MELDTLGAIKQLAFAETYADPVTGWIKVSDSIPITPSFGVIWYKTVDFGFPSVRSSAQDNPQADGTYDETRYVGARTVSIEGVVIGDAFGDLPQRWGWDPDVHWNSPSWWLSKLSAWASPARRFRLYFTDEIGRSRFMDVRGDSFTSQVSKNSDHVREFQLNLVNPSGKVYSFGGDIPAPAPGVGAIPDGRWQFPVDVSATGQDGREYPTDDSERDYPRSYPPGAVGYTSLQYAGTVPNGVLIEIKAAGGYLESPRLTFTTASGTTASIGFAATLGIAAGDTVFIDTLNRTVTKRSGEFGGAVNIAAYLEAPLQWPQLWPGIDRTDSAGVRGYNQVDFTAGAVEDGAIITVTVYYHDADLL